jgi:hypothetical protein
VFIELHPIHISKEFGIQYFPGIIGPLLPAYT